MFLSFTVGGGRGEVGEGGRGVRDGRSGGGAGGGFYSSGAGKGGKDGKGFLEGGSGGQVFSNSSILQWRGLVDLVVVGPSHLQGAGEAVVEVTSVEVVERIPVVVEEDLIMSGEINKITCITGHLLVMVW